jgi:enoyl-CoA hydratase
MILSGRLYSGTEAQDLGLIHRVTEPEDLVKETTAMLEAIFRQPQYALSLAKLAVKASQSFDLPRGLAMESAQFARCFESDFFKNLMLGQLEQGTLQTTMNTGS